MESSTLSGIKHYLRANEQEVWFLWWRGTSLKNRWHKEKLAGDHHSKNQVGILLSFFCLPTHTFWMQWDAIIGFIPVEGNYSNVSILWQKGVKKLNFSLLPTKIRLGRWGKIFFCGKTLKGTVYECGGFRRVNPASRSSQSAAILGSLW